MEPSQNQEPQPNIDPRPSEQLIQKKIEHCRCVLLLDKLHYICREVIKHIMNKLTQTWKINPNENIPARDDPDYQKRGYLRTMNQLAIQCKPETWQQVLYFEKLHDCLFGKLSLEGLNYYLTLFREQTARLKDKLTQIIFWLISYLKQPLIQEFAQQKPLQNVSKFQKVISIFVEAVKQQKFLQGNHKDFFHSRVIKNIKIMDWKIPFLKSWIDTKKSIIQDQIFTLKSIVEDRMHDLKNLQSIKKQERPKQKQGQISQIPGNVHQFQEEPKQSISKNQKSFNQIPIDHQPKSIDANQNHYQQEPFFEPASRPPQNALNKQQFDNLSQKEIRKLKKQAKKKQKERQKQEKSKQKRQAGQKQSQSHEHLSNFRIKAEKYERHQWHGPQVGSSPSSFQLQSLSSSQERRRQKFRYNYYHEQSKDIEEEEAEEEVDNSFDEFLHGQKKHGQGIKPVNCIGMMQHRAKQNNKEQNKKPQQPAQNNNQVIISSSSSQSSWQKQQQIQQPIQKRQQRTSKKNNEKSRSSSQVDSFSQQSQFSNKSSYSQKRVPSQKQKKQLQRRFKIFNFMLSKSDYDWSDKKNAAQVCKVIDASLNIFIKQFLGKVIYAAKLSNRKYDGQQFGDQFRYLSTANKQLPKILLKNQQIMQNLKFLKNIQSSQDREKLSQLPNINKLTYRNKLQSHFSLRNKQLQTQQQILRLVKQMSSGQNQARRGQQFLVENYLIKEQEKQPISQIVQRDKQERRTKRISINRSIIVDVLRYPQYYQVFAKKSMFYRL